VKVSDSKLKENLLSAFSKAFDNWECGIPNIKKDMEVKLISELKKKKPEKIMSNLIQKVMSSPRRNPIPRGEDPNIQNITETIKKLRSLSQNKKDFDVHLIAFEKFL
jgi:hypothetical protein